MIDALPNCCKNNFLSNLQKTICFILLTCLCCLPDTVAQSNPGEWYVLPFTGDQPQQRHEGAFVGVGDYFYLIGGRGNRFIQRYDPATKTWENTGASTANIHHFQAVGFDDKVYIIGALTSFYPSEDPVEQILIFDPATNQLNNGPTIPVNRRRGSSGLVVYNDKFYLIAGNRNGHSQFMPDGTTPANVAWFDEYDPATNQWTTLPDAPHARDHFAAAVVGDRLYVAGGRRSKAPSNVFGDTEEAVDVFDFNTGQWLSGTAVPDDIPTERAGASVVSLGNEVIVIGGEILNNTDNLALSTTEALNVNNGTWRTLADLNLGRHATQAIVYHGDIYTCAGSRTRGGTEINASEDYLEVFSFDGHPDNTVTYPDWTVVSSGNKPRTESQSVLYEGELYVFNGLKPEFKIENSCEKYNPDTDNWTTLTPMPLQPDGSPWAVTHNGIVLVDDEVWIVGGRIGDNPGDVTDRVWIYDLQQDSWSAGPTLPVPAAGGGVGRLGNELHYVGGLDPQASCDVDYHLVYDLDDPGAGWQDWTATSPMPMPRNHFGTVVMGGKLYTIGGQNGHDGCGGGADIRAVHVYDPITDSWEQLADFPYDESHFEPGTFTIDGDIYVVGGQNRGENINLYHEDTDEWELLDNLEMPEKLLAPAARIIDDLLIVAFGGNPGAGNPVDTTRVRTIDRTVVKRLGFNPDTVYLTLRDGADTTLTTILYSTTGETNYALNSSQFPNWLTASGDTGTARESAEEVAVSVNSGALANGNYLFTIVASAAEYIDAPMVINLTVLDNDNPCPTAGTACDDNDPSTFDDQEDGDCNCIGTPCPSIGTVCDDSDPSTFDDQEDGNCNCEGTPCPPAGTACDDGDNNTINDQEDGFCNCEGTGPSDDIGFWLEAECASVGGDWLTIEDTQAANSNYVVVQSGSNFLSTPPPGDDSAVTFTFDLSEAGNYRIWARIRTPTNRDDSFWFKVDNGPWRKWFQNLLTGNTFAWKELIFSPFNLSAGNHTLQFKYRESGAQLDKVYLSNGDTPPSGLGNPASNCGDVPCPLAGTACDDNDPSTFDDQEDGNCNCTGTPCPTAGTACDDGDPTTTNDVEDGFCNCAGTIDCPPAGTSCDDNDPSTFDDQQDGDCNCVGTPCPTAGTACDDGDPNTTNDVEDGFCNCAGTVDCPPAGTPCDDNDPSTFDDQQDGDCNCEGTPCPTAGTACDDGDPNTTNDVEDGFCNCAGTIDCPPAGTPCDDNDPSTFDDQQDGDCNCEGTPCPTAGTACDDGDPNTINDVEDGFCNCAGTTSNGATSFWLEAECAEVGANWLTRADAAASNDEYVTIQPSSSFLGSPPPGDENAVIFTFITSEADSYHIWARIKAPTSRDDSFWYKVDDGPWVKWFEDLVTGNDFVWKELITSPFSLADGPHTLQFKYREDGAQLDKIYVTNSSNTPTGFGNQASNCGDLPCPTAGTACDDNDPSTFDDQEDGNCNCIGTPCPSAGTACDDGDPNTTNDVEDGFCNCAGSVACPTAGTACDDNDPSTFDDQEDGNCNCAGTPCPSAGTACDDGDPNTTNDVEDGFCNCAGTTNDGENIWLEAECATVGDNWTVFPDANASNGAYVLPPNQSFLSSAPDDVEDLVTFQFTISQGGTYRIYGRTLTLGDRGDSFWVRANGGTWQQWNRINAGNHGSFYQWEQVGHWTSGSTNTPVTFQLSAGSNTIDFSWREPNTRLDKIYITMSADTPQGVGVVSSCNTNLSLPNDLVENQLYLFPNPAKHKLNVYWENAPLQKGQLRILAANGMEMSREDIPAGTTQLNLDVRKLTPGFYLLQLQLDDKVPLVQRFIVNP